MPFIIRTRQKKVKCVNVTPINLKYLPSLESLPVELHMHIFSYLDRGSLARLRKVSVLMASALSHIPYYSPTHMMDFLYWGEFDSLLKPYMTDHPDLADDITAIIRSGSFTCGLWEFYSPMKAGCDVLKHLGGKLNLFDKVKRTSVVGETLIWRYASPVVLYLLTEDRTNMGRFSFSMDSFNTDTAVQMLKNIYINHHGYKRNSHTEVRSCLLPHKANAVKLVCHLSGIHPTSHQCRQLISRLQKDSFEDVLFHALFSGQLRLSDVYVQLICWIFLSDSSAAVRILLAHPSVDPCRWNDACVYFCLNKCEKDTLLLFLKDGRIDPSDCGDKALFFAINKGDMDLVKSLIQDTRVCVSAGNDEALQLAMSLGHDDIFALLFQTPHINRRLHKKELLIIAVKAKNVHLVRLLLADRQVDPSFKQHMALRIAMDERCVEILLLLLAHHKAKPLVNINRILKCVFDDRDDEETSIFATLLHHDKIKLSVNGKRLFRIAVQCQNIVALKIIVKHPQVVLSPDDLIFAMNNYCNDAIKLLLHYQDIDPCAHDNAAFLSAVDHNAVSLVEYFLKDPRINPSARNDRALRLALHNGNSDIVKLFLKREDVDPSVKKSAAFVFAVKNSWVDIVERLLWDPRIDPTTQNNWAIRYVVNIFYCISDLNEMTEFQSDQLNTRRTAELKKIGRMLIQNPKVQQKLAETHPRLKDPSVYSHLFLTIY